MPSPDYLQTRPPPPIAARLNRRAGVTVILMLSVAALVVIYSIYSKRHAAEVQETADPAKVRSAKEVGAAIAASAPDTVGAPPELAPSAPILIAPPPAPPVITTATVPPPAPAGPPVRTRAEQEADAAKEARDRADEEARKAGSEVSDFGGGPKALAGLAGSPGSGASAVIDPEQAAAAALRELRQSLPQTSAGPSDDPSGQREKAAFIKQEQTKGDDGYLDATRLPPRSRFQISAGTIIPGILVSGLKSDLPGDIDGQVSANVYDTATGRYLLIPQGTKLFGHYDSNVAFGQESLLAVWQRLTFPDGSTLQLQGMNGSDRSGFSGFRDQVDEHLGRLIAGALLSSVLSAGIEVSQAQSQTSTNGVTNSNPAQQAVGAAIGQNVGQLGVEIVRRDFNVQPTITIRNGYQFSILVNRDVVFPSDYRD
jgi:type IV secretion system protein VirB10